jgi:colanic acid/amylovoran biosynthesis glycosyltransferase
VEALADAMQECLATSPEVLERMGEAAYEAVTERHDVDKEVKVLAALLKQSSKGDAVQRMETWTKQQIQ